MHRPIPVHYYNLNAVMKNIKLIISDMDGTFLNDDHGTSPEFPEIFKELEKRKILFVPASGRQMEAITKYFKNYEGIQGFIAENGGYLVYNGKELIADKLDFANIQDIMKTVEEVKDARAVLSSKNYAYYNTDDQMFIDFFTKYYFNNKKIVDLSEISGDTTFKIAVYHPLSSEKYLFPYFKHFEEYGLDVVVSGKHWMDIMNKNINKGNAVKRLQQELKIDASQTMAFGDYLNDTEMLKNAKYSYAMDNAHAKVKGAANYTAPSNNDFGVVKIIRDFLEKN